ncbi:hypothetical protein GP486_006802 [Trichoglossum hirsutum]|uniref:Uncharacterized protein n=1 Tax=Trichoglossum hirsutum TaxID=265104 RepID=A0A9P8IGF3_9PEZI|nr:hypothetical protein GP486_006802 [Trichoglossum hirsutum]
MKAKLRRLPHQTLPVTSSRSGMTGHEVCDGIPKEEADAIRDELLNFVRDSNPHILEDLHQRPFMVVDSTNRYRESLGRYLETFDKMPIVRLFSRNSSDEVQYHQSHPILYLKTEGPIRYPVGKHGLAFTFIALGQLSDVNGFLALGSLNPTSFNLESGQALHCLGDLEQRFGTGGGGLAILIAWMTIRISRRLTKSQDIGSGEDSTISIGKGIGTSTA